MTMLTPTGTAVPVREQSVTYTSYQRPNTVTENGVTASFAYNAGGDRVKMHVVQGATALLTRYYIGKQYKLDAQTNVERLYLGGEACLSHAERGEILQQRNDERARAEPNLFGLCRV